MAFSIAWLNTRKKNFYSPQYARSEKQGKVSGGAPTLQRYPAIFSDRFEHDDALQLGDIGHFPQLLNEETAVSSHVRNDHFDHEIMFATNDVKFDYFGERSDLADKFAAQPR